MNLSLFEAFVLMTQALACIGAVAFVYAVFAFARKVRGQ